MSEMPAVILLSVSSNLKFHLHPGGIPEERRVYEKEQIIA
jgi:hypothetical protein